jgi:tripartite-type tricarboxylate transporter receptor subunit TctC
MSYKSFKAMLVAIMVTSFCVLALSVSAADFPSRDVRLIVPWPAGGGADGISRKISQIAEKKLGQSIYVENISGAVTATGLMQMTKARPDGHTIGVLTYDSIITLPRGKMVPGYSLDKMTLVARITKEADAIVASKQSGFRSFDDIISAAEYCASGCTTQRLWPVPCRPSPGKNAGRQI